MGFLNDVEVGDTVWIMIEDETGVNYGSDIVLRKLKTKVSTKLSGDFLVENGSSITSNDTSIVEYSEEVRKYTLDIRLKIVLSLIKKIEFKSNDVLENFINKVENLYEANKGVR